MGADQLWALDSQEKDSQCPNYSIEDGAKLQQQKILKRKKSKKKNKQKNKDRIWKAKKKEAR